MRGDVGWTPTPGTRHLHRVRTDYWLAGCCSGVALGLLLGNFVFTGYGVVIAFFGMVLLGSLFARRAVGRPARRRSRWVDL